MIGTAPTGLVQWLNAKRYSLNRHRLKAICVRLSKPDRREDRAVGPRRISTRRLPDELSDPAAPGCCATLRELRRQASGGRCVRRRGGTSSAVVCRSRCGATRSPYRRAAAGNVGARSRRCGRHVARPRSVGGVVVSDAGRSGINHAIAISPASSTTRVPSVVARGLTAGLDTWHTLGLRGRQRCRRRRCLTDQSWTGNFPGVGFSRCR